MKKSKFSEGQVAHALRQANGGAPVGDVRRHRSEYHILDTIRYLAL